MSDSVLTAMTPPAYDTTYVTIDGTPYRASAAEGVAYIASKHITELTARGFTTDSESAVPVGDETTDDQGWAVAT